MNAGQPEGFAYYLSVVRGEAAKKASTCKNPEFSRTPRSPGSSILSVGFKRENREKGDPSWTVFVHNNPITLRVLKIPDNFQQY